MSVRKRSSSSGLSDLSPDSDEISFVDSDDSDQEYLIDFSEPWQFSDVVLVVWIF